jgi:type I restriction enzyme, S subunit
MRSELPKDWKWVRLGDLVDNPKQDLVDGPFGSNLKSEEYIETGVPVFKIQNIKVNRFVEKKMSFISEEKAKTLIRHSFKSGDLIITKLGEPLGLCCKVPKKYPFGIIVADLMRLRPSKTKIYDEYLINVINSDIVKKQFKSITKGTTRARVNLTIVRDINIPLPPKEIQQQIVSKIEELFSELDKGIEELKTAQQQLKVYRQAVLKWAFEGKLTNEDVKDGKLPEGWKSKAITEVAKLNPKIPDRESIDDELEIQFLPMKLVEEIINKFHLTETKKFKEAQKGSYTPFINGDVIFAKVTPCMENGKVAVVENLKNGIGYGSSEFHVIRCSDELLKKYLFYFIVQDKFRNEAANAMTGAVGLRRVPKQFIENYLIPLPPIEEQQQIVQEMESRLSVCDKIEETITNSLKQAEALRQSILKKAFEGKLVSTNNLT